MALFRVSSIMSVKLKHSLWKDNTWYFRRRIPDAIQPQLKAIGSHWAGKKEFLQCLNTPDPVKAERLIAKLKRETDEKWSQLRKPTRAGTRAQAQSLLQFAGVDPSAPEADPLARDVFFDYVEAQVPERVKAEWQELEDLHGVTVGDKELARHLPAATVEALRIVQGKQPEFLASDARDQYIEARCKSERATNDAKRAFKYLTDFLGDKDLRAYRKPKVNEFVRHLLSGGHSEDGKPISTTTVQRYLNTLKAAFGRALRENELGTDADNVFGRVEIPGKGDDVEKRESFTVDQYKALYAAIDQWNQSKGPDQLRCILTVVAATGARLSEIAGLAVSDIHLKAEVPYIELQPHPWRSLKNLGSTRKVRLTHTAIEALKVAKGLAGSSSFLFPNYCSVTGCKGDSASAALIRWVRTRPGLKDTKLGNHSLRHGMKDLLRAVGCPSEAADQIVGHKTPGMGAGYGQGFNPKPCRRCHSVFTPKAPSHLYCSQQCADYGVVSAYLMRCYGIDYDRYVSMLNEQGCLCKLCGSEGFVMKGCHRLKLVVDHCHQTGRVRGLLCHNCNRALGLFQDNPEILKAAVGYLKSEKSKAKKVIPALPKSGIARRKPGAVR